MRFIRDRGEVGVRYLCDACPKVGVGYLCDACPEVGVGYLCSACPKCSDPQKQARPPPPEQQMMKVVGSRPMRSNLSTLQLALFQQLWQKVVGSRPMRSNLSTLQLALFQQLWQTKSQRQWPQNQLFRTTEARDCPTHSSTYLIMQLWGSHNPPLKLFSLFFKTFSLIFTGGGGGGGSGGAFLIFLTEPRQIKSREVELVHRHLIESPERWRAGRWSWSVIAGWTVLLLSCSSTVAFRTLSLWPCSTQLLKEQLAKYISCFALAGSPPP